MARLASLAVPSLPGRATITCEVKGGYFHVCSDSKYMPYNLVCRLDEEFDIPSPDGTSLRSIETACGNI